MKINGIPLPVLPALPVFILPFLRLVNLPNALKPTAGRQLACRGSAGTVQNPLAASSMPKNVGQGSYKKLMHAKNQQMRTTRTDLAARIRRALVAKRGIATK